jgi:hypothetical protein
MQHYISKLQTFSGFYFQLFTMIQEKLNFSYSMVMSPDDSYGVLDEDGNWTGLVGMLHNNEADICINDMTITMERAKVPIQN